MLSHKLKNFNLRYKDSCNPYPRNPVPIFWPSAAWSYWNETVAGSKNIQNDIFMLTLCVCAFRRAQSKWNYLQITNDQQKILHKICTACNVVLLTLSEPCWPIVRQIESIFEIKFCWWVVYGLYFRYGAHDRLAKILITSHIKTWYYILVLVFAPLKFFMLHITKK